MINKIDYRADIDGLRGLAVISVILYHLFPDFIRGGFIGVDVFFVVSGYLITSILIKELESSQFSLLKFYDRRIRRIFPSLILVILTTFIIGWFLLSPFEYKRLGHHMLGGASFISNFIFWNEGGYFENSASTKPLWHLWSLAIEEQFYIVWPFILWIVWIKKLNRLIATSLLIAASFTFGIILVQADSTAAFYSPFARIWEILAGAMIAYFPVSTSAKRNEFISIFGLIYIFAGLFFISDKLLFPDIAVLLPTIGSILLILAGPKALINRYLLSNKFIVWLGLISFPLYLWHWPLLSFSKMLSEHDILFSTRILIIIISILLSWLMYRFVENPMRNGDRPYAVKMLISLMLLIAGAGLYTQKQNGFESRIPEMMAQLLASDQLKADSSKGWRQGVCNRSTTQDFSVYSQCEIQGNQRAKESIMLWGDSQAAHLYPGYLKRYGEKYRIIQRTGDGCPPLLKVEKRNLKYCKKSNDSIFDFIKNEKPNRVVLASRWQIQPWQHIEETVRQLKEIGITNIDLIGPFPFWINGLPQQMYLEFNSGNTLIVPKRIKSGLTKEIAPLDGKMALFAKELNIRYISPINYLCNVDGCLARLGETSDTLTTFDNSHLSRAASEFLVSQFPDL